MEESLQNHVRSHSKLRSITSNWYFKSHSKHKSVISKHPRFFVGIITQQDLFKNMFLRKTMVNKGKLYIYSISYITYITYTHIIYYIYIWYEFPICEQYMSYTPVQKLQSTKLSSCETEDGRLAESSDLKFLSNSRGNRSTIWVWYDIFLQSANKIICVYLA